MGHPSLCLTRSFTFYKQYRVSLAGKYTGKHMTMCVEPMFPHNKLLAATLLPIADRSVLVVTNSGCQSVVA